MRVKRTSRDANMDVDYVSVEEAIARLEPNWYEDGTVQRLMAAGGSFTLQSMGYFYDFEED